jgi:hypothetical protein
LGRARKFSETFWRLATLIHRAQYVRGYRVGFRDSSIPNLIARDMAAIAAKRGPLWAGFLGRPQKKKNLEKEKER